MEFSENIRLIDLELFDAAQPIAPGAEEETRQRFMTLFAHDDAVRRGGSADILPVENVRGERFALKRLHLPAAAASEVGAAATASKAHTETPGRKKELRHSLGSADAEYGSGGASAPTPDYITAGHVAAFYEEYRMHLAVSSLRGFPGLFGFGMAEGTPLILMEWVEGETLRDALRERRAKGAGPLGLRRIADLGISVLRLLERTANLDAGFVHRDLSPRNIMLRTDRIPAADQLESADFDLCLIDFGSATTAFAPDARPTFTMDAGVWRMGTPAYAPPEMLTSDVAVPERMRQSPAIDVYALSSILYELYAGTRPFAIAPGGPAPYRVKTENRPVPLALRPPDGGALAGIIMAGLSTQPEDRPTVHQMRMALENWQGFPGRKTAGPVHGAKHADAAFWQPGFAGRVVSRRKFIAGGIVAAAAIVSAGIVGGAWASRQAPPLDAGRYTRAVAPYTGEPLFKGYDGDARGWVFCTAEGIVACKPATSREPGALRAGLIALYDDASGRYGYITPAETPGGYAWAILPAFAQAGDFGDGLAAVQDAASKRWGFIDKQGDWAIEPRFAAAGAMENGAASVQDTGAAGLWGAIGPNGAWIIEPGFTMLGTRDASGCAIAQTIGEDGCAIWGIVDRGGRWTSDSRHPRLRRIVNGLAPAFDVETGCWGYVGDAGAWAVKPAYRDARPFSEGLAAVQDAETLLWRFIEPDGKPHANMEPRFWKLGEIHDGLAPAQATRQDSMVVFDPSDPEVYTEDAGARYGYVDASGSWQMRRLVTLVNTAIGPAGL